MREFVNYRHPGPRRVWKVGSKLQSTTSLPATKLPKSLCPKVWFRISDTILSENNLCELRSNINRTFILLRKTTTSFCKCSHLSSNLLGNFVDFREIDYSTIVFISFSPRDDDFGAKTCKNVMFSMILAENR